MRRKRSSRTLLALSLLVAAFACGLFAARPWAAGDPATVRAQDASNAMVVDADATTAAVDASITRAMGAEFDVSVHITAAPTAYQGYQAKLRFDPSILGFINVDPLGVVYTDLGGMSLNAPVTLLANTIFAGAARTEGTTSATGAAHIIRFRCIAAGTSSLHLVSTEEDAAFGSKTMEPGAHIIATALTDAQLTCGEGGAPPPTPAASPTASAGPAPTPTPLPPGLEAVDLIAGCNPVASTYPDATPIQTIDDRVGPAGNLASVWKFQAGTWLGYSPQFPEVSDLTQTDFLDAIFICVNAPGAFVRPIV